MSSNPVIVPAVIPQSLVHLEAELARVPFAPAVQVDVIDGTFASEVSWPYGEGECAGSPGEARETLTPFEVEVDLMLERPENHLNEWLAAGATRLVVHIESTERMEEIVTYAVECSTFALGVAFDDDTPLDAVRPYLARVDFVQCMGIDRVGAQGEPFEPRVLENVRAIHDEQPGLPVQVDGSVNQETLPQLAEAGASRFIAGSAIFGADDPQSAYEELEWLARGKS